MTKKVLIILVTSLVLLSGIQSGLAQQTAPLFIIHGTPDTTTNPPEVRTHASVINKSTAQSITDLTADNFQMQEAGEEVATSNVSYEPVGLAVVVVVDRGGISAPGDPRIKEATDLVRGLMDRLSVTGAAEDDIIAIVGVGEEGALQPEENFSYNPVDTNLVSNALVTMEGETVRGGTPLYEGLDEAILLLTENPDATIRDVLTHRRKVVVVFSDGVDPNFSDEARESDIIRKANEADISLYTIGMARRNGQLGAERNLRRLASQTHGLYQLHNNDETNQEALDLFDRMMTQRNQYVLTYETHQPRGDCTLSVQVTTETGSADESVTFSSVLELLQIKLTSPPEGASYTVPYSQTLGGYVSTNVPFKVEVTSPDGAERYPTEVRYKVDGVRVGASTSAPNFEFNLDITDVFTPAGGTLKQNFTVSAEAKDPYLGQTIQSDEANVEVTWGEEQLTFIEKVTNWLNDYWWLLLILVILVVGLIVLLVLLLRTQSKIGNMAQQAVSSTTQALKGVTKQLSGASKRAPGKLVILQGANVGKEFRLATQMVKVGRDPQFCDFALYDEYASNPHFSIQMEQNKFFITDEGSTNGTRLNGRPLQPQQRVPLQPDAIIEVGQTRLQFKRLGGTTRQIGQRQPSAGAGGQAGAPQQQRGGPTKKVP